MVAVPQQRTIDLGRFPKQKQFVFDPSRYVVWCGGRSAAKTMSGTVKTMLYVQNNPGARGLVLAPKYSQLKSGTMMTFFEWFPKEWIAKYNRSQDEMYIDTTNGCRIYFRNALNPDTFRSMEIAFAWLDEAAYYPPATLLVIQGSTRQKDRSGHPFPYQTWVTSTPKGMNWLWKKLVNPATRIKGVSTYFADTRENPWNSEDFVNDLLNSYTGPFREQEIEGKFVTYAGLVYPMFTYDSHVRPPTGDFKKVFAGVDFGTASATSMHLYGVTDGGRYWAFREFYETRARLPDMLSLLTSWAKEFPGLRVYCDPHGATEIETLRANGVGAVGARGGFDDGVRLVASRLDKDTSGEPGLYIAPECISLIAELQSYCWQEKVDGGEHRLFERVKQGQDDHACLAAGTLVRTEHGQRAIETIRQGDRVWTQQGLQRVVAAGQTWASAQLREVRFSDGTTLLATGDHPVYVQNEGQVRIDDLRYGDIMESWKLRPSSSRASGSGAIPIRPAAQIGSTIAHTLGISAVALGTYIVNFGRRLMGRSPRAFMSTTRMGTRSITNSETLSLWQESNICRRTRNSWGLNWRTWSGFGPWLVSGIGRLKVGPSIHAWLRQVGRLASQSRIFVNAVAAPTGQERRLAPASALLAASRPGVAPIISMPSGVYAFADGRFRRTASSPHDPAPVCVLGVSDAGRAPVYNLTVEHNHHYYASDILVSNCDEMRYAMMGESTGPVPHGIVGFMFNRFG